MTAGVISLSLFLGGGTRQGLGSDAIVGLASLVLIAACVADGLPIRGAATAWPFAIIAAVVVLPLIQLVPLPPSIWTQLPGRTIAVTAYQVSGIGLPWLPISLDPHATWVATLSLLPPIAVFLATIRLGLRARRSLSLLFVAFGIVSVMLGLAQLMQGPASPLRFFPITNTGNSVGFFANRNHYAALLCCLIPFTTAWVVGLVYDRRPERALGLATCLLTYVLLVLGLAMALSRAGIALAAFATVASLLMIGVAGGRLAKHGLAIMGFAVVLAVAAGVQFAFYDILSRFGDDPLADFRFTIAQITIAAAGTFQPVGSGFGTFVPIYQIFETPDALMTSYVNHAHNDWLEIWLEGGWLAVAVAAGFVVWLGYAAVRAWRAPSENRAALDRALACAASIAVFALLLHSATDYPLRTTALMTVLAFSCALLIEPVAVPERLPPTFRAESRQPKWQRFFRDVSRRRKNKGWHGVRLG